MSKILTTGDVARLTGWTIEKVRALCESGKLPAINTSTGKRPRWSIRECDLDAYLTPPARGSHFVPQPGRRRRQRIDADVAQVF